MVHNSEAYNLPGGSTPLPSSTALHLKITPEMVHKTEAYNLPDGSTSSQSSTALLTENEKVTDRGQKRARKKMCEKVKENDKREHKKIDYKYVYVGESSRSGYERGKEHVRDYQNLEEDSHFLKHYLTCHRDIEMSEMKFGMRLKSSFRTALERQIEEAVSIDFAVNSQGLHLTQDTMMKPKN